MSKTELQSLQSLQETKIVALDTETNSEKGENLRCTLFSIIGTSIGFVATRIA